MNETNIFLAVIAFLLGGIWYELTEVKRHIFDNLFDIRWLTAGEDPHKYGSKNSYEKFKQHWKD